MPIDMFKEGDFIRRDAITIEDMAVIGQKMLGVDD